MFGQRVFRSVAFILKAVFSLRYQVQVKEKDLNLLDSEKGILFLPNHTSRLDPIVLTNCLWTRFRVRPIAVEYIHRLKFLRSAMDFIGAISIPNFDLGANEYKIKKAKESVRQITEGLKKGDNFLLYPSGRLKKTAKEVVGGSSGVYSIVQEIPDVQIVLIRITGFWGSSFSRAIHGHLPDLNQNIWNGIKAVLKNLIFLTPRRKILVEIEKAPADFPRISSRLEINRYMEDWFNQYPNTNGNWTKDEPLVFVSYSRWREKIPNQTVHKNSKSESNAQISPELRKIIYTEIARILDQSDLKIAPEMNLATDLGMDSLNLAELVVFLSRHSHSGKIKFEELETVQDILDVACGTKTSFEERKGHFKWPKESNRPNYGMPKGSTLVEAFLDTCNRFGSFTCCADDIVGVFSYKKCKRTILVLGEYFKSLPGTHIGVLLPASVSVYMTVIAIQFSGKIPVMLNWTLGPHYLNHMIDQTQVQAVISSWNFIDRLQNVEFGSVADKLLFLEDIREEMPLKLKLKAVLGLSKPDKSIAQKPAVILFTSGTESVPKGVPLTHQNLLSNLHSIMKGFPYKNEDRIYGILPPFHSFGFSVFGLVTLCCGLRTAFYPDPTDSFALAEGIERWEITHTGGPPTFLKRLFSSAKKDQLKTLRILLSGGEAAHPSLFKEAEEICPLAKLIEGYGITECAPCVAIGRPHLPKRGIGPLLPDIDICTIQPETKELLTSGQTGEICIAGPNVFNGYLNSSSNPFIELNGKKWFRSGDLGYLDNDGNLILSGRLKRFIKLGGEMISLRTIEDSINRELVRRNPEITDLPAVVACSDELEPGRPRILLFTKVSLDRESANEMLKNSGLSSLIKISHVEQVAEFPLLGAGKINYRSLVASLKKDSQISSRG